MAEELRYRFTGDPDDLVRATRAVGTAYDDLADDARKLDHEIGVLRAAMRDTATEIARAADEAERKSLLTVLARQRRDLGMRIKLRDLIDLEPPPDEEVAGLGARMAAALGQGVSRAGGPIADALGNVFGVLPPQAQAGIGAGVLGAVTVAAPAVAAVVSGAITGGIAAGGVAAGIALASRDARVKAAADGLGETLLDALSRAAAPAFVPPVLRGIDRIRFGVADLDDELADLFGAAARHADPFIDALVIAGSDLVPKLAESMRNAGPAVDSLANGIVMLTDAAGDGLRMMSEGSVGAGQALEDLFVILAVGVRGTAALITGLTYLYEGLRLVTGGASAHRDMLVDHAAQAVGSKSALDQLADSFLKVADKETAAADAGRDVLDVWSEIFGATMGADQALIRYEESWDRLVDELNDGKKSLDINTEAGRENMGAILGQIDAINGLYEAGLITDSQYQDHLNTLERAVVKRGFEAGAVQRVIDKYRAIPTRVNTEITNNAVPARERIDAYIRKIGDIPSSRTVTIYQRLVASGVRIAGLTGPGGFTAYSQGGYVDGPGPAGVDSVPALLAPGEGVLTVDGLRRLGGRQALDAINAGRPLAVPASTGAGSMPAVASRTYAIQVSVPPTASLADVGRVTVEAIQAFERSNGASWRSDPP